MSAASPPRPGCLDPTLPCWRLPRATDGLVAVVSSSADSLRVDEVLARDGSYSLVWAAVGPQPERAGLHALHRSGVRAISIASAGRDLRRVWAALQFAYHLGAAPPGARAHLTGADAPATVDRSIRVPHLISVRYGTGTLTDTVVWELMVRTVAPEWSRVPPTDQAFIESHLQPLVTLRGAARSGCLPSTVAGRRLASALSGRPLTIRTVYQRLDLLRPLLVETSGRGQRSPPAGTGTTARDASGNRGIHHPRLAGTLRRRPDRFRLAEGSTLPSRAREPQHALTAGWPLGSQA